MDKLHFRHIIAVVIAFIVFIAISIASISSVQQAKDNKQNQANMDLFIRETKNYNHKPLNLSDHDGLLRTKEYYLTHDAELNLKLQECKDSPQTTQGYQNCQVANQAEGHE